MGEYGKKLQAAGYPCGFSSQWQQWILLENYSAWHNVPIATKQNGFAGFDTELLLNTPLHVRLIDQLAQWQKTKTFDYGGRKGDANPKFATGECGMFLASSASYAGFVKATQGKFEFGISMMPYWPDVAGAPQNSIIGGATLWVLSGHKPEEYKGVAKFFSYLSSPEVQAASHQRTGYLPITLAAYELTKKQGFYEKNPGTDTSIRQMNNKPPTDNSKGLRLGNYVQIRDVMDEELEARLGRQEDGEGRPGRDRQARERAPAPVRAHEPSSRRLSEAGAARPRGRPRCHASAVHKRVVFRNRVLPYLLVAPQMLITLVFFIWPAGPGAVPVAAPPGRVRAVDPVRLVRELRAALRRRLLPARLPRHRDLQRRHRRPGARPRRSCWRSWPIG